MSRPLIKLTKALQMNGHIKRWDRSHAVKTHSHSIPTPLQHRTKIHIITTTSMAGSSGVYGCSAYNWNTIMLAAGMLKGLCIVYKLRYTQV